MADPKFTQGNLRVGRKNIESLGKGLAELAKCDCGVECDCYGYLTLPNWISTTGERQDGFALYFVDGAPKIDTVENAKIEIDAYKAL